MNKEEFKISIMNQVRDINSVFTTSVLNFRGGKIGDNRYFRCSEFDVDFIVERTSNDRDFQIIFIENNEEKRDDRYHNIIDLSKPNIVNTSIFAMEGFSVGPTGVLMTLDRFKLSVDENYQFSKEKVYVSERDIALVEIQIDKYVILNGWQGFRSAAQFSIGHVGAVYSPYELSEYDISLIDNLKWSRITPRERIEKFRSVFIDSRASEGESSLMHIIKVLDANKGVQ